VSLNINCCTVFRFIDYDGNHLKLKYSFSSEEDGGMKDKASAPGGGGRKQQQATSGGKAGTAESAATAGWKEVVRKSKKVSVPSNAISRVIGRGGSNINAIRYSVTNKLFCVVLGCGVV